MVIRIVFERLIINNCAFFAQAYSTRIFVKITAGADSILSAEEGFRSITHNILLFLTLSSDVLRTLLPL